MPEISLDNFSAAAIRNLVETREREKDAAESAAAEHAKAQRDELRKAFESRTLPPDALQQLAKMVEGAVERGEREVLVLHFPASFLEDGGRRINIGSEDWPQHLNGFAARAAGFYEQELRPRGFQLAASIIDFPGGKPGDVGFFLRW